MSLFFTMMAGGTKGVLTLSGEAVSDVSVVAPTIAGIRINTDGTIDKREGAVYTPIDVGTDWIVPNNRATTANEFRITSVTYTSGTFNEVKDMPVDGTWYDLTGGAIEMSGTDTNPSAAGVIDIAFTLEVRRGSSGAAEASGPYSIYSAYETI